MKKRFLWADLVRIVAIYFVLVVHSSSVPTHVPLFALDMRFVSQALITICVPLFVMLSGALLLGKKESYSIFFSKRFSRIFLPWVFWSGIGTLITIFLIKTAPMGSILKEFSTRLESYWFIPMIIGLYFFTPALRLFIQAAKPRDIFFVLVLWFIGVSLLPYTRDSLAFPMNVDNGLVRQIINNWGYFILGYYLLLIQKTSKSWLIASGFLIIGGITWTLLGEYILSLQHGGQTLLGFYSYSSPSTVLTSIGVFLFLIKVGAYLETLFNQRLNDIISYISSLSLGIFFIHQLIQELLVYLFGKSSFSPSFFYLENFLNAAILFLISLFVITFIKKIPFGKYVAGA